MTSQTLLRVCVLSLQSLLRIAPQRRESFLRLDTVAMFSPSLPFTMQTEVILGFFSCEMSGEHIQVALSRTFLPCCVTERNFLKKKKDPKQDQTKKTS